MKNRTQTEYNGRELAAIDGSKFKAVNSTDQNFSQKELTERIKRLSARIDEYMQTLNKVDTEEDEKYEKVSKADIKEVVDYNVQMPVDSKHKLVGLQNKCFRHKKINIHDDLTQILSNFLLLSETAC